MKEELRSVDINGIKTELRIDPSLHTSVLRALTGTTPTDQEVDLLSLPTKPLWLSSCIRLLRWYRATISPILGQRCVYEPSCSRYAELALRKHGLLKGVILSAKRLHRCKPGCGGVDLP
ncbi:membrane protein insertion efficiency factor YidD [Spirosoma oryzicola]|uniref:membrane protein insertion efficiency factor YidD n=1 Tax=Spirosoma oryzicola TaxID=2898794 RepID=UPI001E5E40FE|nr:membrane protein insertion efficiency factor YidD [Spirosoma oryzicola]UHG93182.1 membrane protein insertion efficiency factor YidD [Spirosoma oryzicola]